ncbi:hypothetical protein FisN_8Hh268 [Fistulifera solaris]|uniref:Uncharacterized protein n=1 Tax=Fistulifera solaris TaxID=1519565 RepID=A0A1Z5JYG4_FISSO|nr:hypothetical protein FisN_8Hh268 [Fistulifera solaris]|eukprot:GAX19044.1 hypothetical protein FisN_8Hh268 [Fistulifera solaris]
MGGGAYMTVSETHTRWGEAFTVVCWLWIFHRARQDLPVVLGFRHPWEHAHDPFEPHVHHPTPAEVDARSGNWDTFSKKSLKTSEDDDEEEEEEEEEEDE